MCDIYLEPLFRTLFHSFILKYIIAVQFYQELEYIDEVSSYKILWTWI